MRYQINVFIVTTEFYHQNISSIVDVRITSLALFPEQNVNNVFSKYVIFHLQKLYESLY